MRSTKGDGRAEPADRRQVDRIRSELGMVFQSFNLWSHMTILENVIEAPMHVQKRPKGRMCRGGARSFWRRSASATNGGIIPRICRGASSSAPPSRGRWR